MSPVTSIAKPFARPSTQCPYCDHVSPVGSKFCGECGAALHLIPCPHCGAVNDITAANACYRCHGELRTSGSAAPPAPASIPAKPVAKEQVLPYVTVESPARPRPHTLVVAIVLIAFAAASYYAFRQRTALEAPALAGTEAKGSVAPASSNANAGNGTILKAPAEGASKTVTPAVTGSENATVAGKPLAVPADAKPAKPDTEPPREAASPNAATNARPSAARIPGGREPGDAPTAATPDIARARVDASKGLEQRAPNIGPCTAAVAALGLCTPEPNPTRQ